MISPVSVSSCILQSPNHKCVFRKSVTIEGALKQFCKASSTAHAFMNSPMLKCSRLLIAHPHFFLSVGDESVLSVF